MVRERGLQVLREPAQLRLQVDFEGVEPRFGPLEPLQREIRRRDGDFAQCGRFLTQLPDGLLVDAAQRLPLVADRFFQLSEALRVVLLEPILDGAPVGQPHLGLVHDVRVQRVSVGPAAEDFVAALGEARELLRRRLERALRLASHLDGEAQAINLCLEIGGRRIQPAHDTPSARRVQSRARCPV